MNVNIFNASLLIGWVLILIGGMLLNVGAGLAVGGVTLIGLAMIAARLAGGIYLPKPDESA